MSDILIKGMEMPTSCGECKAFVCYKQWAGDRGDCFCGITKSDAKAKTMNADCPLIPVPDHGRLIDADKLEAWCDEQAQIEWNKSAGTTWANAYLEFGGNVYDAPTIIPAEEGE